MKPDFSYSMAPSAAGKALEKEGGCWLLLPFHDRTYLAIAKRHERLYAT
jgi:hypothetical protein